MDLNDPRLMQALALSFDVDDICTLRNSDLFRRIVEAAPPSEFDDIIDCALQLLRPPRGEASK